MKAIAILCMASLFLFSCKKEMDDTYKVRFVTTGSNVTQFKFTSGSTVGDKSVPFSGTQDTTIVVAAGTTVKLDLKASSNDLVGSIFVNDSQVATGRDADTDGDGKTQVKLEYSISK